MMWFLQVKFLPNKTRKNLVKIFLLDFYDIEYRLAWSVFREAFFFPSFVPLDVKIKFRSMIKSIICRYN